MEKVSVIGAGTWGIALAKLLFENGHYVTVWSTFEEEVQDLKTNHAHRSLPNVDLPRGLYYTSDLQEAMKDAKILVLAVPSIFVRATAKRMREYYEDGQIIVNVAKGIEEHTLMIITDQIEEEIPGCIAAVLSGPSHAEEVSRRLPTTCVVGAKSKAIAEYIQNVFMNPYFRVYTSPDMLGIELGGSLKNVIALAAGISDGLGYGDNTKAAIITRGIAEIARLGMKMGANSYSFAGLSGIGDLIVTCASKHSRNRKAGFLIGQGKTMEEAIEEVQMVVEGVYSAKAAMVLSEKYDVSMPIVEEVNKVLFEGKDAKSAVDSLMQRERITESAKTDWEERDFHT